MTQKNEIMDVIGKLLRVRVPELPLLNPGNNAGNDAVDIQASHMDKIYYRFPPEYTPGQYIHDRFGHITVNPQNDDTTDALIKSYVTREQKGRNSIFVNHSPDSIREFLEELIGLAEQERNYSHRHQATITVLHGPKGSGKTFFLNHILARYSPDFDRRHILWVRVNLTADFSNNKLRHWIYAQCTKVLLRYYDPISDYYNKNKPKDIPLSMREHLEHFVNESQSNPNVRQRQLTSIQQMCQIFQKTKRDEKISPSLIPLMLAREAFYYALEQGYRIIVALDGLDLLEATASHCRKFAELYKQAIELAHSFDPFQAAILVVTRTNTLNTIPETGETNPFTRMIDEYKRLHQISVQRIIGVRKSYIANSIDTICEKNGWPRSNHGIHIEQFAKFLEESGLTMN